MTPTITITVPGRVWEDFLDPDATGMQAELGLPADAPTRSVGKGYQVIYRDIAPAVALELAAYLADQADTFLANSDPEFDARERGGYRAAIRTADKIRREAPNR